MATNPTETRDQQADRLAKAANSCKSRADGCECVGNYSGAEELWAEASALEAAAAALRAPERGTCATCVHNLGDEYGDDHECRAAVTRPIVKRDGSSGIWRADFSCSLYTLKEPS